MKAIFETKEIIHFCVFMGICEAIGFPTFFISNSIGALFIGYFLKEIEVRHPGTKLSFVIYLH